MTKVKDAAVLEPKGAVQKQLCAQLMKAGLKVTGATEPGMLKKEQLVLLGPSLSGSSPTAKAVRKALPHALLLVAKKTLSKVSFADGLVPLPLSPRDLAARLPELLALKSGPQAGVGAARAGEGILDPLTQFYTFAHFKEVLFIEVKRARRYGIPLSVAQVAFDPLSAKVTPSLREQLFGGLALSIRRSLRDTDYPVQYSADRVLLLMPHTDLQGALVVSRRICERVSRASLPHGKDVLHPTISVGVAAAPDPRAEFSFADLMREAQHALDAAVAAGGNRVEFYDRAAAEQPPSAPP